MIIIKTKPISTNRLYRGRRYLTEIGKATKTSMGWEIKKQWKKPITTNDITVKIYFYIANKRSDLDNLLKGLLDILTGIIWKDDSQVSEIHCFKIIDKKNPRIELEIL